MKKFFLLAAALSFCCIFNLQAQILYRISGNGLNSASYIVGTYHLAPASFADSIPGLRQALDETNQVCGELDMMDALKPENVARMQQMLILPEGVTLSSLLTDDQLDRLNAVLLKVMGSNFENETFASQMEKMTPVALTTSLTLACYSKENKSFNPLELLDSYFQNVALMNGKTVLGFETVDFQAEILYNQPLPKQVEGLMCLVDNIDASTEITKRITDAFFSQDLQQIEAVMEEESNMDCASSPEDEDVLINNRNHNWVEMMPKMMAEQPTFFAVGAAHLCGEQGVLKLLECLGYTIEGVK